MANILKTSDLLDPNGHKWSFRTPIYSHHASLA